MENKHEILLGLTTTPGSDWRGKVAEIKKFGITKIALFPTFIESNDRKELYGLLEQITELSIPHVHLRSDMELDEVTYLSERFGVEVFNKHSAKGKYTYPDSYKYFNNQLYIENTYFNPDPQELVSLGGLCIDYSHWEMFSLQPDVTYHEVAKETEKLAKSYNIGCCHVSAIQDTKIKNDHFPDFYNYSVHYMTELSQLDYMEKYKCFLPCYVSLELENSFKEQLEAKAYLEKILNI